MTKELRYRFVPVEACIMCGSASDGHRVMGRRLNKSHGRNPKRVVGISTTVVRCTDCGLVYSNPQPIPFDIQDHYGVPPETYWQPEYFQLSPDYLHEQLHKAHELLGTRNGMRALDIGAGIGKGMLAMERAGFEAHGFEPSNTFHERGVAQMGMDPARFKLGMIEELDYPADHFDFISFGVVLEHIYDPSAALLKAMGWMKPGGVMHIEVPSADWLVNRLVNIYYRLRGTDLVANLSPMHEPFHLHEFTPRSFQAHAKQHGYEIASQRYYVCKTFLPTFLDPILKPWMEWTDRGMQLSIWLRKPLKS
ncbi:MAG: class I SAM-dependent methyltransferase [Flavobacteriales bacterium]|nr:class I SAM-dependent methyltransferase [Flavobacteriales bacterium]